MKNLFQSLWLLVLLLPGVANAATFANQFIEFQLPEKWKCQLDGTEWVCQSEDEQKKRDAIIVLAAKLKKVGVDDLDVYKAHLEKKQVYQSLNGETIQSEPRYVKQISIAGHAWIDSLHLQSEIPDFYTRYLATIESDLGILVTFSVRKDKYDEYAPDIDAMVKSLRAFRKPGPVNGTDSAAADTGAAPNLFPSTEPAPQAAPKKKQDNDSGSILLLLAVLAGAIGFIIVKRRRR